MAVTISAGSIVSVAGVDGSSGNAMNFNSSGSLMSTDAGLPAALATRSYGAWFKTLGTVGSFSIIVGVLRSGEARFDMINTGIVRCLSNGDVINGPFCADGQWHNVVAVEDNASIDGVKRKMYMDGRLVGISTVMNGIALLAQIVFELVLFLMVRACLRVKSTAHLSVTMH